MDAVLREINANYTLHHTSVLMTKLWWLPLVACAVYLLLVALGKKWMETKQPYSMRTLLFVWNSVLAAFSILGAIVMAPPLIEQVRLHGFEHTTCHSVIGAMPILSFFSLLFVLSKVVEFGDTFFIIVRKTPLNFLHWYHHVSVCIFSWHSLAIQGASAHWFCAMNYFVHSVMYSYYMIKSTGTHIPKFVALGITILQLVQFFVGFFVACTVTNIFMFRGDHCESNTSNIALSLVIYFSYFVLFANFFYQRYLKPSKKKIH